MPNIYTAQRHAFGQGGYFDQQGTALAGMPAYTGDYNYVDSFIVGDVGEFGLEAGLAVISEPAGGSPRVGVNELAVRLPGEDAEAGDIVGVVARGQQMGTNVFGRACYFRSDLCPVARVGRSGARIWARLALGAQPEINAAVYVGVGGEEAGRFSESAGTGFVAVPSMRFISAASDGLALVELL